MVNSEKNGSILSAIYLFIFEDEYIKRHKIAIAAAMQSRNGAPLNWI
jgi:hypothetical protein